jgi:hypothetical protein
MNKFNQNNFFGLIRPIGLSGIESGRFFPSLHVLDKMSSGLGVELMEFFKFSNVDVPENLDYELTNLIQNQNEKDKFLIYKMLHAGFAKA